MSSSVPKAEQERIQNLAPIEKYKESIQKAISEYRDESKRYRTIHNFFQYIIIIGSLIVTTATGAISTGAFGVTTKWIALAA